MFQFSFEAESILIHKNELNYLQKGSQYMTVAWITPQVCCIEYKNLLGSAVRLIVINLLQEVVPKPSKDYNVKDYKVHQVTTILNTFDEGDRIDLGDKSFKVLTYLIQIRFYLLIQLAVLSNSFSRQSRIP